LEARQIGNFEGEISFQKLLEVFALLVVHDVVYKAVNRFVIQSRHVDTTNITVDTNHRRQTRGNV
jgi:hypothetical protein